MTVDADTDALARVGLAWDDLGPDKNKLFLRLFLQNERRLYAYILTLLQTGRMRTTCCKKPAS